MGERRGRVTSDGGLGLHVDFTLDELRARDVAEAIQLGIEYDPAPPLDAGHPERVSPALRERLYRLSHKRDAEIAALAR